jgi:hypothetical protein
VLHEVLRPFLQLAEFSDLEWDETRAGGLQFGSELCVDRQNARGLVAMREEFGDQRHVHGAAGAGHGGAAIGRGEIILGGFRGQVVRRPDLSSTSQCRQNSAEPFMSGYAVPRRKAASPLKA